MIIKNLSFHITRYTSLNNRAYISFYCEPYNVKNILLYYQDVCSNLDEFNEILADLEEQRKLPSPTKNLGCNDSNLIVYGEKCRLDCEFISGLPPLEISTEDVIYFFTKFRDFYIQYQECQIPGLIPDSKLDTWLCVPDEYVSPAYLQRIYASFDEILDKIEYEHERKGVYRLFRIFYLKENIENIISTNKMDKDFNKRIGLAIKEKVGNNRGPFYINYQEKLVEEIMNKYQIPAVSKNVFSNLLPSQSCTLEMVDLLGQKWYKAMNDNDLFNNIVQQNKLQDYASSLKMLFQNEPHILMQIQESVHIFGAEALQEIIHNEVIKMINDKRTHQYFQGQTRLIYKLMQERGIPKELYSKFLDFNGTDKFGNYKKFNGLAEVQTKLAEWWEIQKNEPLPNSTED